jgi:hypothetical protein
MRHVVLALAIVGALLPAGIAIRWLSIESSDRAAIADGQQIMKKSEEGMAIAAQVPQARKEMQTALDKMNEAQSMVYDRGRVLPFLLVGIVFAVGAAVLAELRQGVSAGILLLAAYIGPGIVYPITFCFGFLLLPPAILAFFVRPLKEGDSGGRGGRGRPRRQRERDLDEDEDEDDRPVRRRPLRDD